MDEQIEEWIDTILVDTQTWYDGSWKNGLVNGWMERQTNEWTHFQWLHKNELMEEWVGKWMNGGHTINGCTKTELMEEWMNRLVNGRMNGWTTDLWTDKQLRQMDEWLPLERWTNKQTVVIGMPFFVLQQPQGEL